MGLRKTLVTVHQLLEKNQISMHLLRVWPWPVMARLVPLLMLISLDLIGLKIQAYKNDPSRELQDKADIQFLFQNNQSLDLIKIEKYAKLFNQWESILELKSKNKP